MIANLLACGVFALAVMPLAAWCEQVTCVTLEAPPVSYVGSDGRETGFAVEVARSVFSTLGKSLDVKIYPLARALAMIKSGQADCAFSLVRSSEREQFLAYSNEQLVTHPMYFYARKSEASLYTTANLPSLAGLRVGVVRQTYNGQKFESLRSQLVIDESANFESDFRKLLYGRVNLVICSAYIAHPILALPEMREGENRIVRLEPAVERVATFAAFGKTPRAIKLKDGFDVALKKFSATPAYLQLRLKYGIEPITAPYTEMN